MMQRIFVRGQGDSKEEFEFKPFHNQQLTLSSQVTMKEADPCWDVRISMHIAPKCKRSIWLRAENLQQPYHTCFL